MMSYHAGIEWIISVLELLVAQKFIFNLHSALSCHMCAVYLSEFFFWSQTYINHKGRYDLNTFHQSAFLRQ